MCSCSDLQAPGGHYAVPAWPHTALLHHERFVFDRKRGMLVLHQTLCETEHMRSRDPIILSFLEWKNKWMTQQGILRQSPMLTASRKAGNGAELGHPAVLSVFNTAIQMRPYVSMLPT